ncbi:transcriptional regulator PpsR [Lutimaribacter sp. EGI FJ00015]|uniref:Transcriptional regulator PpsR n=1 Tax=Lutimaribacter degradans TaxID=2945989 RepID=A0ACC5ZV60_9RHOB|nr:transcriptional regulator PpsR [Lutimaribacter sp. EGI FJ00013]MCM2562063.1 transcriptional regulator PpsR [Lutimaribacter sp. EGI FJ00013]MCO0615070.1 transcriptional regulator PpsR [Lutimaribacter sp. EGI FJ00015]MCO0635895.1 transcriptional regulator PpsR [Lutimaribacter sp. EGI FJ00014]
MIEPDLLNSVLAAESDVALIVSDTGHIQSVLIDPSSPMSGVTSDWEGRSLRDLLGPDSAPKIDTLLTRLADGENPPRAIEVNHIDAGGSLPVRYSVHPLQKDGSLLFLGRDLRVIAETHRQLVQAQVALERGYEERREYDARYRMLLANTRDAVVFVSVSDGRIKDLNAPAASLLGATRDELTGAPFSQEFKDRRRGEFVDALIALAMSDATEDLTVQARRSRYKLHVHPAMFRAAGERILICRIEAATDGLALDDRLTSNLSALYRGSTDGFVFTDLKGMIEDANESFLELTNSAQVGELRGRSLADFLARGQIDLSVMLENAMRSGHMRSYSTRLTNDFGGKISVEMSVAHLNGRDKPAMAFIIRDVSRTEALRGGPPVIGGDETAHSSVIELVGSASLKDIVAETSEVIEKLCIEAAVDLTRNNRAAAAEMLGLSRQSLYVKLRKYGLLHKDSDS